jgi:hypothetical protein
MAKKNLLGKARAKIAALEAEGALRLQELALGRALCAAYEKLCFETASALRLVGEQMHGRGQALSGQHLLLLADKLTWRRGGEAGGEAVHVKPRGPDPAGAAKAVAKVVAKLARPAAAKSSAQPSTKEAKPAAQKAKPRKKAKR